LKLVATPVQSHQLPNLERAAGLLHDLPALWLHPGMTDGQRETLVREVFRRITIDEKDFVSIEPKAEYVPLFTGIASGQKYGYREFDPGGTPPIGEHDAGRRICGHDPGSGTGSQAQARVSTAL
jgi:hypothetical protein